MELAAFTALFERVKEVHLEIYKEHQGKDPEFEITEPLFFMAVQIEGEDEPRITGMPVPDYVTTVEAAVGGIKSILKKLQDPEILSNALKAEFGPAELVAAFTISEGWQKNLHTGERLAEMTLVVIEDLDYNQAMVSWEKRKLEGGGYELVETLSQIDKATYAHEHTGRMQNLLSLPPKEVSHAS